MMGWMAPLRHRGAKLVFLKNHQEKEPSMSEITTIGLDLAKHVFQVHGVDAEGTTVVRKRLRRGQVLAFFSRIPRCVVGLEACATAHYWARELRALGHEVRLMPARGPRFQGSTARHPMRWEQTNGTWQLARRSPA